MYKSRELHFLPEIASNMGPRGHLRTQTVAKICSIWRDGGGWCMHLNWFRICYCHGIAVLSRTVSGETKECHKSIQGKRFLTEMRSRQASTDILQLCHCINPPGLPTFMHLYILYLLYILYYIFSINIRIEIWQARNLFTQRAVRGHCCRTSLAKCCIRSVNEPAENKLVSPNDSLDIPNFLLMYDE